MKYPHLQQWKEGDESLVYCCKRFALVHLNAWETTLLEHLQKTTDTNSAFADFLPESDDLKAEQRDSLQRVISVIDASRPLQEVKRHTHATISWAPAGELELSFQIASLSLTIHTSQKQILQDIHEILKPNLSTAAMDAEVWHIERAADGKWQFGDRLNLWFSGLTYEEIMPLLLDQIQNYAYAFVKSGYQITFHGAALSWGGNALLIPGISGAGKSTLASALSLQGAVPCSDEIAVLDSQWQLLDVPLPFAIKSGSWNLIGKWQGRPLSSSLWSRRDGRQLRYWWPPSSSVLSKNNKLNRCKGNDATTIILPCFQHDAGVVVREASLIETIQSMTTGGYEQADTHSASTIPSLIEWLKGIRKIKITYGDARLAAQAIQSDLEFNHVSG